MEINWSPKAAKQLIKLKDQSLIARIHNKVLELENFPNTNGVKALTNHTYSHRLRVGNYRIFFNVKEENKVKIIQIEEVKKRDERTY